MQKYKKLKTLALALTLSSTPILIGCASTIQTFDRMTGRAAASDEMRARACEAWLPVPYTMSTPAPIRREIIGNNAARDAFCNDD